MTSSHARAVDLLIRDGTVLTLDAEWRIIEASGVAVQGEQTGHSGGG